MLSRTKKDDFSEIFQTAFAKIWCWWGKCWFHSHTNFLYFSVTYIRQQFWWTNLWPFWWENLWKILVENFVENFCGKCLLENFGVHAIFDILETPALKKYSICWVFEALFVVIVVFIFALSLSSQDVMSMSYLVISHNLHNTTGKNCELSLKII